MNIILLMSIFSVTVFYVAKKPENIVLGLAAVVSLVGVNIHFGVTLYFSRLIIIIFFISLLMRMTQRKILIKITNEEMKIMILLSCLLISQIISIALSNNHIEGFRELLIYISLIFIYFITTKFVNNYDTVAKAIDIYIFIGLIQGLYGIYQVIGGPLGWPTYQTLLPEIQMANDRTEGGYYYNSGFRAIGFFSSDVSHYAGYLAGVIILIITLLVDNNKSFKLKITLVVSFIALILSMSRSGIIACFIIGIPTLIYLFKKYNKNNRIMIIKFKLIIPIIILIISVFLYLENYANIDFLAVYELLISRFSDIINPGKGSTDSMSEHLITRYVGLDAFLNNPVFGVGLGVNATPWKSEEYNTFWAGSHSHHINILGQVGLIGTIIEWLIMSNIIFYMIKGLQVEVRNRKKERNLLIGLLSTYITIVLGNFLYFYYLNDFVWFIMGCGVALSSLLIKESQKINNIKDIIN